MTATLLAANAAWTGLVIALWTKRLWETHYARLDCLALIRLHRTIDADHDTSSRRGAGADMWVRVVLIAPHRAHPCIILLGPEGRTFQPTTDSGAPVVATRTNFDGR